MKERKKTRRNCVRVWKIYIDPMFSLRCMYIYSVYRHDRSRGNCQMFEDHSLFPAIFHQLYNRFTEYLSRRNNAFEFSPVEEARKKNVHTIIPFNSKKATRIELDWIADEKLKMDSCWFREVWRIDGSERPVRDARKKVRSPRPKSRKKKRTSHNTSPFEKWTKGIQR